MRKRRGEREKERREEEEEEEGRRKKKRRRLRYGIVYGMYEYLFGGLEYTSFCVESLFGINL